MSYQTIFEFSAPTRLVFGSGALQRIPQLLDGQGRILIVTDPGVRNAGLLERLTTVLDRADRVYSIFDETEANPSGDTVERCTNLYRRDACALLVAIGGGSSMDVAKGTGVLAANGGTIMAYEGWARLQHPPPFLLCIPTTYGTGSEVTPFTVITDRARTFKATIGSEYLFPKVAVLDPDLAVRLPMPIAGSTGMDALTHAIEAYVCLAGNTVTRALAIQAAELIAVNLRQAASSDHNLDATGQMLLAATLAGRSFGFTRLGNVHALAHPLGAHFNIPHGVANAVLLPYVMEYNLIACPDKYARIALAMGVQGYGLSEIELARKGIAAVRSLAADVGIPRTLADLGVDRAAFRILAEDAIKSGNIPVNPRKTSVDDLLMLLERAYAGG
jgi:alcohol dehydrogenase class IV